MSEYIEKLSQIKKDIGIIQDSIFFELYNLNEANIKLKAENAKLRQGLELYAKIGAWGIDQVGAMTAIDPSDHEDIFHQEIGITTRGGKLARQILREVDLDK